MKLPSSIIAILFTMTLLNSSPSFGNTSDPEPHPAPEPNGCEFLVIQLGNNTPVNCIIKTELIHGSYYKHSTPPNIIMPGRSRQFTIRQSWYGPDVKIAVNCGDTHTTEFRAQQNYCFFEAGNITHDILSRHEIGVEQNKIEGSYWHSIHGISNWLFSY